MGMNGADHPATLSWDGPAPPAGLLELLARHLPPALMIGLDGPAPEGLSQHFPKARRVLLPEAMAEGPPAAIDLLLQDEGEAPLSLLGQLQPGCVIIAARPADLRRSFAMAALRRFGPTRPGRMFALEGRVIILPPAGSDPASDAIANAMPGLGATALPDATARFQIIIESFADRLLQGSDAMLHGVIYNLDGGVLDFDQARHDPLRIGARLWRHGHPTTLAEPRAVPAPPPLLPEGGRLRFKLRLPTADLPPGEYGLTIDLVREGVHWFEDLGHPVVSLMLEITPGPSPGAEAVPPAIMADLALLGAVLRQPHLIAEPLFEDIRRAAFLPHISAPDAPDEALLRVVNALVELAPGCPVPITRMMLHLRASLRMEARWHLSTAENRFAFLCWYVREAPGHIAGGAVPVPEAISRFLNADALPHWAAPLGLSRLIFYHWRSGHHAPHLLDPMMADRLLFEWVTAELPYYGMDAALVPEAALAMLEAPTPGQPNPRLTSHFAMLQHAGNPTLRERHDLTTPEGQLGCVFALLIGQAPDHLRQRVLGPAALRHLAEKLDDHPDALTRMEFLVAACCGVLGSQPEPIWRSARLQQWFSAVVCQLRPDFRRFASQHGQGMLARAPRCTVIGMAESATGLGVNLRMTTQALQRIGIQPLLRDLGQGLPEIPLPPLPAATPEVMMQRDVVIIHINADQAPQILAHPAGGGRPGSYRNGFFLWEMEVLPQSHRLALELVDEIWVPSAYLARLYTAACDKPVINMRKGITLPATIPALPRARNGIDASAFCFFCSFDFHSAVERKNPMAAVQAFQLAFPPGGDDGVRLVIKSTEFVPDHRGDPHGQWPALQAAALADPRINIIAEAMAFDDYLGLIACMDCVVSAHRAEGFGYLPAYGMLLGKPAIVTDYSGTQEYCDETTAFPVRATLRPVQPVEAYYPVEGAVWADVDVPHMAERMREVLADPASAQRRSAAGRTRLERDFSEAALSARYAARLSELGAIEANW